MKRYALYSALLLLVLFVAIQFIPVKRTNRLGAGDPQAPRNVQWILRRACYDCHSTETRWPIWAYVAPMSWQVVGDVGCEGADRVGQRGEVVLEEWRVRRGPA